MIIHKVDIEVPRRRAMIYQDTDTHIDSDGHDDPLHKRFIGKICNDRDAYWVHTGDMFDDDRPSTRELKMMSFRDRPEILAKWEKGKINEINNQYIKRYEPIAKKCLGIIDGDHYYKFHTDHDQHGIKAGMTSGQYLCKKLGMPYLGERMGFISIVFRALGKQCLRYDILARHGKATAKTPGGDVSAIHSANVGWDADLLLGGHSHKQNVHNEKIVGVNKYRDDFCARKRFYIRGGSFLRGFAINKQTYAEAAEYSPLCLGWGSIELTFGKPASNNGNIAIIESKGSISVG
jgi:hypothetical protein